jgi:2-dehydropantoate 2-reductase
MAENDKFKIAVLGIGGVGGYFGGRLAARFNGSGAVEVFFIARGENEKAIKSNGLKIVTREGEQLARPATVTNEAREIGAVDVLLICTKAYDLEESIVKFRDCIGENTAILPLLNGVDNAEKIRKIVPRADVWNGCAFIVARLNSPGVVKVDSEIRLLQFGSSESAREKLEGFEKLLKVAEINAELSGDIDRTVWEKFIFISSLATLTSYLDTNIGGINASDENRKLLAELIAEVTALAAAKNINVAESIAETTLNRIKSAPAESTSSMHSDFMKKGRTELETLTGYVVRESNRLNLPVPVYERLYAELRNRI